jgi:dTDP-L-rhamnose 4-epimerase
VLVTGGAGFIGSAVVDLLADRGDEVVVVDNLSPAAHAVRPDYLRDDVDYRWVDLANAAAMAEAVAGVDAVCHQAARVGLGVDFDDVTAYVADNDGGTAVLLRALWQARFGGRLVVASSMVVYGEGAYACRRCGPTRPGPRTAADLAAGRFEPPCPICGEPLAPGLVGEDAPVDPRNVYAISKLATEHLAMAYGREAGVPTIALRYHNVYGPRMPRNTPYAGVASLFRSALAAGVAPQVFEDGGQRRDFVHVHDVARANLAALDADPAIGGAFNVASGSPHTIGEAAHALAAAFGAGARQPVVTGQWRLGDVRHVTASTQRAAEVLGFRAEVPFATGMAAFATAPLRHPLPTPTPKEV